MLQGESLWPSERTPHVFRSVVFMDNMGFNVGSARPSKVEASIIFSLLVFLVLFLMSAMRATDKGESRSPFSGTSCQTGHPRFQVSLCALDLTYTIPGLDLEFGPELFGCLFNSPVYLFLWEHSGWGISSPSFFVSKLKDVGLNQYANRVPLS